MKAHSHNTVRHSYVCFNQRFFLLPRSHSQLPLCQFYFTTDNEPPKISCPSDKVTNTSETEAIATVTWDLPTYSDNSQTADPTAELKLVSDHKSPKEFAIGSHTVTYTVTDSSGKTAHCSFDIQVKGNWMRLFLLYNQTMGRNKQTNKLRNWTHFNPLAPWKHAI